MNGMIKLPGFLSPFVIHETISFRWLRYIETDPHLAVESSIKDQIINENTSIGLLSALVFTVSILSLPFLFYFYFVSFVGMGYFSNDYIEH